MVAVSTKSVSFTLIRSGESKLGNMSAPSSHLNIIRFKCDGCHKAGGTNRKDNKYTAKKLQTTRLGSYIETRVNNFLRKKEADSGDVHIRVVFSGDKQVEVKPGMKNR